MNKILIISDIGRKIGLGHYVRAKVISEEINFFFKKTFKIYNLFFNIGDEYKKIIKVKYLSKFDYLKKEILKINPDLIFLNNSKIFEKKFSKRILKFLNLNCKNKIIISIDSYIKYHNKINHVWIPNVVLNKKFKHKKNIYFGWDKLIIQRNKIKKNYKNKNLLFSTGGADKYELIKRLPFFLKPVENFFNIHCLIGPYSKIPKSTKLQKIRYIKNIKNIKFLNKFNFGFVTFGVSFFEFVHNKILVVAYIPKNKEESLLINFLKKKGFIVCTENKNIAKSLKKLITNENKYKKKIKFYSDKINLKKRKSFYMKLFQNPDSIYKQNVSKLYKKNP